MDHVQIQEAPMDKQDAMLSTLSKTSETALSQHNPIGTGRFSYSTLSNLVLPPLSRAEGKLGISSEAAASIRPVG